MVYTLDTMKLFNCVEFLKHFVVDAAALMPMSPAGPKNVNGTLEMRLKYRVILPNAKKNIKLSLLNALIS